MDKKDFNSLVNHLRRKSHYTVEIDGHHVHFRWSYVDGIPAVIYVQSRDCYFGSISFNRTNTAISTNSYCTEKIIVTMLKLAKEFEIK